MKKLLNITSVIPLLFLMSCAMGKPDLEVIKNTSFANDPFREGLRLGYIELAKNEWNRGDKEDAARYAKKATILTKGATPKMELLYTRDLSIANLNNLLGTKYFLEAAFVNDIKEIMPNVAASAQVNFDCLVEVLEEGEENYIDSLCKESLARSQKIIARKLDSIKAAKKLQQEMIEKEKMAKLEKKFEQKLAKQTTKLKNKYRRMPEPSFIFFDFNKTALDVTAQAILGKVARDIELFNPRKVIISGNADNVGSYSYNMKLALKRGEIVADYLVGKYGVSPAIIDVKAYGKNNPRKEHNNTKKEIRNRYVEIKFLKSDRVYYTDQNLPK